MSQTKIVQVSNKWDNAMSDSCRKHGNIEQQKAFKIWEHAATRYKIWLDLTNGISQT